MAKSSIRIQGPLLAALRKERFLTQRELGDRMDLSEVRVRQIEKSEQAGLSPSKFRRLAETMKIPEADLQKRLGAHEAGMLLATQIAAKAKVGNGDQLAEFDRSLEPYSEVASYDIPLFELSVAAGPWTDVSDVAEVHQPGQIDHGFFRIRLAGDSMTPTYRDGDVVEFRCMRADREGPMEGKDYYVQRADGTATFKRIVKLNEDTMTLAAMNKRKYPQAIIVERGLVVRMAVAIAKVELL